MIANDCFLIMDILRLESCEVVDQVHQVRLDAIEDRYSTLFDTHTCMVFDVYVVIV
jgi:hypothetical protein